MKSVGIILTIIGVIGILIFGIQAINSTESFNILGVNIAISDAEWTPVIVSFGVAIVGVVTTLISKKGNK